MFKTRKVIVTESYEVCDLCNKEFGSVNDPLAINKVRTKAYTAHEICVDKLIKKNLAK